MVMSKVAHCLSAIERWQISKTKLLIIRMNSILRLEEDQTTSLASVKPRVP